MKQKFAIAVGALVYAIAIVVLFLDPQEHFTRVVPARSTARLRSNATTYRRRDVRNVIEPRRTRVH